jgi:hypothetical protein
MPWFERTSTTSGILTVLHERNVKIGPNAHFLFEIAVCHAHLGQLSEAKEALTNSIAAYRKSHAEMPGRTWCLDSIAFCERLDAAIQDCKHEQLLDEWRAESVRSMKLEKIMRRGH